MKLSGIFGKKILNNAGKEGYVLSAGLCGGTLYLLCADDNEREFCVRWDSVLDFGGDGIVYDGREESLKKVYALRLGLPCYDFNGTFLGNLEDCTVTGGKLKSAKAGKKTYPAGGLVWGDAVLVKELRRLNCDVVKDGKKIFKKGEYVTDELLGEAVAAGEYVQTTLKSLS